MKLSRVAASRDGNQGTGKVECWRKKACIWYLLDATICYYSKIIIFKPPKKVNQSKINGYNFSY